nr:MAG TPA: hypothetical protein [Caudoviricetes sp.]
MVLATKSMNGSVYKQLSKKHKNVLKNQIFLIRLYKLGC